MELSSLGDRRAYAFAFNLVQDKEEVMASEMIEFEVNVKIIGDHAIAVEYHGILQWLPHSVIEYEGDLSTGEMTIEVPEWVAHEKGMI